MLWKRWFTTREYELEQRVAELEAGFSAYHYGLGPECDREASKAAISAAAKLLEST